MQTLLKRKKLLILIGVLVILLGVFLTKNTVKEDKDTIAIATMGEPASLDPHRAIGGTWEQMVFQDIVSGLIEQNSVGESVPSLAQSWTVSPDGKTYTFKLRDSKWSDGVPVTAHDFAFSYKRMLSPEIASNYVSFLYVIKGGEAYNTGKARAEDVGVRAVNDKTLEITLEEPISYFINALTHFAFFPVPKHVVEKHGKDWTKVENIVNNGAYKLVEWKSHSYIKATRNDKYWDAANVKIGNIIYYTQEDRDAILKRFRSKEIDIVSDFSSDKYDWLMQNMKEQTFTYTYNATFYLTINLSNNTKKPLLSKNVRTALAMAIDREFITDKVLRSGEIPAYAFIPTGLDGYVPVEVTWKTLNKEQRLAKARELLLAEGISPENPITIELAYNTSENDKKIVIAISNMWKELGINTELINREVSIHFGELLKQNFNIGRARWVGDYDEASTFLDLAVTTGSTNYSKYSNLAYDNLVAKGKKSLDKEARNRLYSQAETILLEDLPVIPVYYFVSKNLVAPRVKGWQANTSNFHLVKYLSLEN
ncbi:ABC-type oligopeptide transport system, periplasmic component [Candidatus Hepatincolaceae symbiont of Richtersius coronifer]